jgi:thiamine biosynthesis protein ThiS
MKSMIIVNNDDVKWSKDMTVSEMLKECNFTYHSLIVKINDEIVPEKTFRTRKIPDKAIVKVIHMMTGG